MLEPDGRGWWSPRAQVRTGNEATVLIDGDEALGAMQTAIGAAQESVHIAGWHSSPDLKLTRDDDAPTLRELLATVAERVPVRLLMWAGPPLPAFQPTRKVVKATRDESLRRAWIPAPSRATLPRQFGRNDAAFRDPASPFGLG